mgnify:CR=1 FL=1
MKIIIFLLLTLFFASCQNEHNPRFTNSLKSETSPYLLQHAENPVNWMAWNTKTLSLSKTQNKLMIISVGYSACHWCHVMEEESFMDTLVAKLMNKSFINIKVDREERPDVDEVYMNALQLMTGEGGWPMNIIALPDGRPIWGGTYLEKDKWLDVVSQISTLYSEDPEPFYDYADKLEKGVKAIDLVASNEDPPIFKTQFLTNAVNEWSQAFDTVHGGVIADEKFMMPNNYHFLLRYAHQTKDKKLMDFIDLTLQKIAYGGVFDHVEGGFSRYSTDSEWHIPHFEKMLYDNGLLVSLYSDAYLVTKKEYYKDVVVKTLEFIKNEMTSTEGGFYSSIDASSTNYQGHFEEGAYYTWEEEELKTLFKADFDLFSQFYNINELGYWKNGKYVLIRSKGLKDFAKQHKLSYQEMRQKLKDWHSILLRSRRKRDKPRVDDKILIAWNSIMMKAYLDAYRVLGQNHYLTAAKKNASFIQEKMLRKDGGLYRNYKDGSSSINAYLEDYAFTIDAFLTMYETTLDDKWLFTAKELTTYTFQHFFNKDNALFYSTSNLDKALFSRPVNYRDNVMPSGNSVMATNSFKLSQHFENDYDEIPKKMLNNIKSEITHHVPSYSNWLGLMLNYTHPFYEVVIVGDDAKTTLKQLNTVYKPNKIIAGSVFENDLPLLKSRYVEGETYIYVCTNQVCKHPTNSVYEALALIKD